MQASKPRRVLVVDDNMDAAETLAMTLTLMGHEARVAFEGETALSTAAGFRPDIVILDIGLPGADGFEVVQRMREMPELCDTRIAALTGYSADADRERGLACGFDDYFIKPIAAHQITRLLAEA